MPWLSPDGRVFKNKPTGRPKQTHCINGHEFTPENVYSHLTKEGLIHRACLLCIKKRRKRYIGQARDYQLKWNYGISSAEYDQMALAQNHKCYLCREHADPLCVDHNHKNGEIRKLLCNNCNLGIGYFKENPELLRLAADYCKVFNNVDSERSSELVSDIKTDGGYVEGRGGCC